MDVVSDVYHLSVRSKIIALALSMLCLAGCMTSPDYIPVVSRTMAPTGAGKTVAEAKNGNVHTVRRGETLYAIAVAYKQSFRELAHANNLPPPYTIHPGQRLHIGHSPAPIKDVAQIKKNKVTKELKKKTVVSTSHGSHTVVKSAPNKKQTITNNTPKPVVNANNQWRWPASGKLLARFSRQGTSYKGIAIAGDIGESVVATASGEVVYSGAGLTGYGNLIIIRHNSRYLSAYAHNRTLLVGEGDQVKAGQQIAELGSTGTNEPKLHFEIRQNGKPVDPLLFLPNR